MTENPIFLLFRSRKVIIALVTAIVNVLVVLIPSLEPVQTELLATFTALALALIGGIAFEDGKEKGAPTPTTVNTGSAENVNITPSAPPTTTTSPENPRAQVTTGGIDRLPHR